MFKKIKIEEYERIFNSFNDLYYQTDALGKIKMLSLSVERIIGYTEEELMDMPIDKLYVDKKTKNEINKILEEKGRIDNYETKLRKKNGEIVDILISSHSVCDIAGKCLKIEGFIRDISIRKKSERALKESEEKYRTLVNNVNIGVYRSTDMKPNKFLQINPAMVKIFGYDSIDEMMKISVSDLYPTKNERAKIVKEIIKNKSFKNKELVLKKKNGESIIVSVTAQAAYDENGKFKWMDGVLEDITERKTAEEKIKSNLKQQKMLADISVEMNQYEDFEKTIKNVLSRIGLHTRISRAYIFEDSSDGKSTSNTLEWCAVGVNPQIKNLQNIRYKDVPGWAETLDEKGMILSNDISMLSNELRAILESQGILSVLVLPLMSSKGKRFGFIGFDETRFKREWDSSEINLLKIVASSISSIYERKKSYRQIQDQSLAIAKEKDKLNAVIQSIGDAVFVIDNDYRVILLNGIAVKMSGYQKKNIIGERYDKIFKFVFEKNEKPNYRFIERSMKSGQIQKMKNHTILITKNNKRIPITDSAAPIRDNNGKVVGCVIVFHDVTYERRIERLKTEFVSVASHQLKTPLTGIKWFSELLMNERIGKLSTKQKDFLDQIHKSNQRMLKLVSDLLDVSHIDTGKKFEIRKSPYDIEEIIDQAVKDNTALIKEKNIIIKDRVKTVKRTEINIDKEKIRQVFYNLISNAIKYSKQDGVVEISCDCSPAKRFVDFHIKDNGIGIPAYQQKKMFSKFFRADNAVLTQADGTGLGLYIARAIVEAHGGKMWFESEENKGTIFHFSLKK